MNRLVVMKFGGTSVEDVTAIHRTAGIVAGRRAKGLLPVVVVSAMAKVTDQLLAAAAAAARGDRSGALAITARLRHRHQETACALVSQEAVGELNRWLDAEFDALDEILRGLSAVGELTPRISDMVVSYGERLSSRMIAVAFNERGLDGVHVDARQCIVTDAQHGRAIPQDALIEQRLKEHVLPHMLEGRTVVMGGFIGSTESGVTTTLGRGGSDFTAALVGGGIDAGAIEIWTDVNGIMTTDPRVCPNALRVKAISFEEAAELAYFGAKVLHPATILPAVKKNIPVLVLNSRNPENEGTRITALAPHCRSPFKCIAVKKRLTIIDVVASRMLMSHGYLKAIFDVFDKHKCAVDMVSTSEVSVSLTVDSNEKLPEIAADLSKLADVKYEGRKALVCMVGENIRGQNGIAARVFGAITHVNVRMISQGASEINMSFMIEEEDADEAVRSLHAEFFADPDPEVFDVEAVKEAMGRG
ncbi:lysine-sensitive aspartokinase 3 [Paracidobacterium acidisoli]|uniref:Aspartokinase n=1 Tax=Paracidobacterium acidisoli TaxID=2303751 RepID=A0A372IQB5_9BACT|nr:lysine-sensitive aspartokinase 3 [Paracidobacterium acidisoli]MBT9331429.1 lysine-sensitive aspartokinase 3 [Paracidobacterium acidisoli]